MKLPRWLLWSMVSLSVAAVLAVGAWWWVTWPERTARQFVSSFPTDGSNPILSPQLADILQRFEGELEPGTLIHRVVLPIVLAEHRSLTDILIGRECFFWEIQYGTESVNEFVVVERGWIVDMGVIIDKKYSVLDP